MKRRSRAAENDIANVLFYQQKEKMKKIIKANISEAEIRKLANSENWYRCVPHDSNVYTYRPYELEIHCGSIFQAEHFNQTKYDGQGDIYEVSLKSDVNYSNVIEDSNEWNDIRSVWTILHDGFDQAITMTDVTQDLRQGKWYKSSAKDYILSKVGNNCVVVYQNAIEVREENIIVLSKSCIHSCTKLLNTWPSSDEFAKMNETEILKYVGHLERAAASALQVEILSDDSLPGIRISDEIADNADICVDYDSWITQEYKIAMSVRFEIAFQEHFKLYLRNLMKTANWIR